jgi:hypothetical protein
MTIGKIKATQTYANLEEGQLFSGMDITAQYLNPKGKVAQVNFHYSRYTNDLRGQVERVLSYLASGKPMPEEYTNIVTE